MKLCPSTTCLAAEVPEPEFFIVLFLTGAVFIAGALITALAIFSLRRNKSSKVEWALAFVPLGCGTVVFAPFFLLLLSWIAYWVLPHHKVTQSEVVRQYQGALYGAKESLNLRMDGRFEQTIDLPTGEHYQQEGHWTLKGNYVELDDSLAFYDSEHNKRRSGPSRMWDFEYEYFYKDELLVDDRNSEPYILKGK